MLGIMDYVYEFLLNSNYKKIWKLYCWLVLSMVVPSFWKIMRFLVHDPEAYVTEIVLQNLCTVPLRSHMQMLRSHLQELWPLTDIWFLWNVDNLGRSRVSTVNAKFIRSKIGGKSVITVNAISKFTVYRRFSYSLPFTVVIFLLFTTVMANLVSSNNVNL